jgi:hypothetical protein
MAAAANGCWSKSSVNKVELTEKKLLQLRELGRTVAAMMPAPAKRFMRAAKSGAGFFALSVFLLVQVMAAVPAFHAWAHQDARDPGHECAVTLILNGQFHTPVTEVEVTKHQPVLLSSAPARSVHFISADVRLLPSRGPPA